MDFLLNLKPYWSGHFIFHKYSQYQQDTLLNTLNNLVHEIISEFINQKTIHEIEYIYNLHPSLQHLLQNYYENYFILMNRYKPNNNHFNNLSGFIPFNSRIGIHMFCQLIISDTIEIPYNNFNNKKLFYSEINNLLH